MCQLSRQGNPWKSWNWICNFLLDYYWYWYEVKSKSRLRFNNTIWKLHHLKRWWRIKLFGKPMLRFAVTFWACVIHMAKLAMWIDEILDFLVLNFLFLSGYNKWLCQLPAFFLAFTLVGQWSFNLCWKLRTSLGSIVSLRLDMFYCGCWVPVHIFQLLLNSCLSTAIALLGHHWCIFCIVIDNFTLKKNPGNLFICICMPDIEDYQGDYPSWW